MENNNIAVNVGVRVRPVLIKNDQNVIKYIHEEGEPPVLVVSDRRNIYAFDYIFSNEVHQCEIYNVFAKPLVFKVLEGYNSTILAYGQTGTGKTYTMGTNSEKFHNIDSGLIPRVLEEFFEIASQDSNITISISFIEIYNEKVYDLLSTSKTALVVKGFNVTGMTCVSVEHNEEACHWLLIGGKRRHVRLTALNATSSRSHAIFTIYCTKTDTGVTSKLHLIDLAGSESVRRTGNRGTAFQEGVTINRGLLAVGRVISALSDKRSSIIPYRDNILTTILHDSLCTNNYVSLLACISPSEKDISETLATLRFTVKAKRIKSRPQLESFISEYENINSECSRNIKSTVKKKRKFPDIFTSTQIKKPLKNFSLSLHTENKKFMSSPNISSATDISQVLTSTVIDIPKQTLNLSLLKQQCADEIQNNIPEHENKENTPVILNWPSIEKRLTTIIRRELSELTTNGTILNGTKIISKPVVRKELDFDSPLAVAFQNNKFISPKKIPDDEHVFKVPNRNLQIIKKVERKNIAINTSPVPLRRSMRLSTALNNMAPTPAPRYLKATNTPNLNFCSPFKSTRRSMRLSLKCINVPSSEKVGSAPTPAPRRLLQKTLVQYLKSPIKFKEQKTSNVRIQHQLKILNLLNVGSQKDLQSLATIGVKTATQILTYRTFNGVFNQFEDLKSIPTWGNKKFDRFMQANQLH